MASKTFAPPPGADPAESFPTSSTHGNADPEPFLAPPLPSTSSSPQLHSHEQIGKLKVRHGKPDVRHRPHVRLLVTRAQSLSSQPPPQPHHCLAARHLGHAPPSRMAFLLKLDHPKATRAPCRQGRSQLLKSCRWVQMAHPRPTSRLLAPGKMLGGQTPPRCLEAQSCRCSVEVVQGTGPLAPGAQEPHLHPPRHRCGDGDVNLCELHNACKQHLHLSELEFQCSFVQRGPAWSDGL
jgi:hypothetical protein